MAVLRVATGQFPVCADVGANLRSVVRQLRVAKARSADVAHFPEGALSGYAPSDLDTFEGFAWDRLREAVERVCDVAGELGMWVVVGSAHRLNGANKPHNSLYVVNDAGALVDRYDKRFCAGDPGGRSGELTHYSPGDHPSIWDINGVRCGALICYEYRFPELHRVYKREGVEMVFHSFHAAHATPEQLGAIGTSVGRAVAFGWRTQRRALRSRSSRASPGEGGRTPRVEVVRPLLLQGAAGEHVADQRG